MFAKSLIRSLLLVALAFWVCSPAHSQEWPDQGGPSRLQLHLQDKSRVVIGSNFVLKTNETATEVVVIGGNALIEGEVGRNLVVVGGKATISGTVHENVTVVLGAVELTPTAAIHHDSVFIGGPFNLASEASFGHDPVIVPLGDILPKVEWFKAWVIQGLILGRLLPLGLAWPWIVALCILFVYLILLVIFPRAVKTTVRALEFRPVASIFSGLLALVLSAPLVVLLLITLVGIFVIPFLKLALLLGMVFGKIGILCFIGGSVLRTGAGKANPNLLLSFVIGAALLCIAYMIPILGLVAFGITTVFGLGGAIVALFGTFKKEEAPMTNLVPPGTIPPVAGTAAGVPPGASNPAAANAPEIAPAFVPQTAIADPHLLPRAGFWKRFLASMLDLTLVSLLLFIPPLRGFFILFAIIYFVSMWTWRSTTIGGIVMGLKIVRTDGNPVTFAVALVRSLSSLFSAVVLFLGFLWAGWDREKQSWHDKIAGTVVVKMPRGFALI